MQHGGTLRVALEEPAFGSTIPYLALSHDQQHRDDAIGMPLSVAELDLLIHAQRDAGACRR